MVESSTYPLVTIILLPGCESGDLANLQRWMDVPGMAEVVSFDTIHGNTVSENWIRVVQPYQSVAHGWIERDSIETARGEWIWFIGPEARPAQYDSKLHRALTLEEPAAVIGQGCFRFPHRDNLSLKHPAQVNSKREILQSYRHPPALEAIFWRRDFWFEAGGFSELVSIEWRPYELLCRLADQKPILAWPREVVSLPLDEQSFFWKQVSHPEEGHRIAQKYSHGAPIETAATLRRQLSRERLTRAGNAQQDRSWFQTVFLHAAAFIASPRFWFLGYAYPILRDRFLRGKLARLL